MELKGITKKVLNNGFTLLMEKRENEEKKLWFLLALNPAQSTNQAA